MSGLGKSENGFWQENAAKHRLSTSTGRHPGERVVVRVIVERFDRGVVADAPETCSVIGVDDVVDVGVSVGLAGEAVLAGVGSGWRGAGEGLGDAAVEAFDHAVGLRVERPGELVDDAMGGADPVERMVAGGWLLAMPPGATEAVGELGAVVGENGVDLVAEAGEEAFEAGRDRRPVASGDDRDMGEAGAALDGDEHIGRRPLEPRQVLEIDVHEAERGHLEHPRRRGRDLGPGRHPVPSETAIDGATRQLAPHAALHHLDDVLERQPELGAQFQHQLLLQEGQAEMRMQRRMGVILHPVPRPPASDRHLAHPKLSRQLPHRLARALDVGPSPRCRRRIGVSFTSISTAPPRSASRGRYLSCQNNPTEDNTKAGISVWGAAANGGSRFRGNDPVVRFDRAQAAAFSATVSSRSMWLDQGTLKRPTAIRLRSFQRTFPSSRK
jgi:hypothetical protein